MITKQIAAKPVKLFIGELRFRCSRNQFFGVGKIENSFAREDSRSCLFVLVNLYLSVSLCVRDLEVTFVELDFTVRRKMASTLALVKAKLLLN